MDIVPTLSTLFEGGIPPQSIGVSIESVLNATFNPTINVTSHPRLVEDALRENALQLSSVLGSAATNALLREILVAENQDEFQKEAKELILSMDIGEIRRVRAFCQ